MNAYNNHLGKSRIIIHDNLIIIHDLHDLLLIIIHDNLIIIHDLHLIIIHDLQDCRIFLNAYNNHLGKSRIIIHDNLIIIHDLHDILLIIIHDNLIIIHYLHDLHLIIIHYLHDLHLIIIHDLQDCRIFLNAYNNHLGKSRIIIHDNLTIIHDLHDLHLIIIHDLHLIIIHDLQDCRIFLNAYNNHLGKSRMVYTFPALSVTLGGMALRKPAVESYKKFWVDFNIGSAAVSVMCDKAQPEVPSPNRDWETVVIFNTEVLEVMLVKSFNAHSVTFTLRNNVLEYIVSSFTCKV